MTLRYEDYIDDYVSVLERMERFFGLIREELFPWRPSGTMHTHPEQNKGKPFDQTFYSEKRYLQKIPPAFRQVVSKDVDWESISRLGYAPEGKYGL